MVVMVVTLSLSLSLDALGASDANVRCASTRKEAFESSPGSGTGRQIKRTGDAIPIGKRPSSTRPSTPERPQKSSHRLPKAISWEDRLSKIRAKYLVLLGGRTRARTWDPLIKSQLHN